MTPDVYTAAHTLRKRIRWHGSEPVTIDALLATRDRLFQELPAALDANERVFLRTLVHANPAWSLLEIPHLEELPAIRWRLQNLQQLQRDNPTRWRGLCDALDQRLQDLP